MKRDVRSPAPGYNLGEDRDRIMADGKTPQKFHHIQALRGIAATLVVLDHAMDGLVKHGTIPEAYSDIFWNFGDIGVSAFFIISGFIMVVTNADGFGSACHSLVFIKKRLIRIMPIYWIATFAICAYLVAAAKPVSLAELLKSLFFIPYAPPGGYEFQPLLGQGWTLNYEMFFYALFAAVIPLGMRRGMAALATIFLGLFVVGCMSGGAFPILHFYTDKLILLFLVGVWIGYARIKWPDAISFGRPGLLIATALVLNIATFCVSTTFFPVPSFVLWTTQAFCVVVSAFSYQKINATFEKIAEFLGDASYSTYLFHTFLLAILNRTLSLASPASQAAYVAIALIGSNAIGLAINRMLEQPLTRMLRSWPTLLAWNRFR